MGNKKYVLGNYELGSLEIHLLTDAITLIIECNTDYLESFIVPKSMEDFLKHEINILKLMLEELRKYGD